jgi:hypothetical protein
MYKTVNFNSATTSEKIGQNTKARVTVKEGRVMIRFTERTSDANLSDDQLLKNLSVKGSGRRIGLPSAIADHLPEPGAKVALIPGKYGWFTLARFTEATNASLLAGSVSA